ncbi:MAG: SDR family NAD(P)-dependent oxidoreductase [Pseudomonadota bacterium]
MPRKALVTGANRGIGKAIARGLIDRGCEVYVGARSKTDALDAADELGGTGILLDVSSSECIASAAHEIGHLDVLINNAGVLYHGSTLANPDEFRSSMSVMFDGPYELIRAFAPGMVERGYGRIVNLSSGWGAFSEGLHGPGAYGVAKAALNALTLALSHDLPDTVKINAMCPGWVRTRMGGASASLSPEEGADTAIWLATLDDDGPTGGFFRERQPISW